MPTVYQTPGVYIEELPSGSKPINGVSTSVAAFIGFTEKRPAGNTGQPHFVASWNQYVEDFGSFVKDTYTPLAVYGFFLNGGSTCYVQSLATTAETNLPARPAAQRMQIAAKNGAGSLELTARPDAPSGTTVTVEIGDAEGEGANEEQFKVTVRAPGREDEVFNGLSMAPASGRGARTAADTITASSKLVRAVLIEGQGTLAERRPANNTFTVNVPAASTTAIVSSATFEGSVEKRSGIGALAEIEDVTMVIAPDLMAGYVQGKLTRDDVKAVQTALLNHCELMQDRFAILDALPDLSPQEVRNWRMVEANFNSKYGAMYYPWIYVANPDPKAGPNDKMLKIPPSGHIAGLYARVDSERGVYKAPANEIIRGALKLERSVINSEQTILNPNGINCIRAFPGRGILVWGARTLSSDTEWQYINVRRLFNYIEESIFEGTQWAVFEPNDMDLWERVKRTITAFLTRIWRDGALFGTTPEEAFYVKCDAELNPPSVRDVGMLIVEVGIAPVKPAEFVIFRFKQMSGGGEINE